MEEDRRIGGGECCPRKVAMKALLQGKPLHHPLHPLLVHFPIGLFFFSFVLDLASLIFREAPGLVAGAYYSMALGLIGALIAAVPGFADYFDIRRDHPAKRTATWHMRLNLCAVGLYAANLYLRHDQLTTVSVRTIGLALSFAGVILLSVSGYLGGKMVYDDGISVGRHRRRADGPGKTCQASMADAIVSEGEQVFVAVADAERLQEGEILRADVDGTVMTIAKVDGRLYAFQEFCTHRYGPLSEGALKGAEIECPWHRSCFDIRSGKVTHGPAKVDLKTYPVKMVGTKISVGILQRSPAV
jgi:uncharacterized membrane protein/nitrite reductase/ring-hydroxylating ferredoxin subunit